MKKIILMLIMAVFVFNTGFSQEETQPAPKKIETNKTKKTKKKKAPSESGLISIKSARITGYSVSLYSDSQNSIYGGSFGGDTSYTVKVLVEFNEPITGIAGGEIDNVEADNGESLVISKAKYGDFGKKIQMPQLSKDRKFAALSLNMKLPSTDCKLIKELSGTLNCSTGTKTKEVDLGITDFSGTCRGTEYGAELKVGDMKTMMSFVPENMPNYKQLQLKMDLGPEMVKDVKVYDSSDNEIKVPWGKGYSSDGKTSKVSYNSSVKDLPESGKIIAEIYEDITQADVQFTIKNAPAFDFAPVNLQE